MSEEQNDQQSSQQEQSSQPNENPIGGIAERLLQPPENNAAPAGEVDPWDLDTWQDLIPDKFKKEGAVDLKNLAKSYLNAEKRIGTGDVPPKDESGYKVEVALPEGMTLDPDKHASFLKKCHGSGMTNKQVNTVMEMYTGLLTEAQQMQAAQKVDSEAVLKTAWGDKFDSNLALAQKAFHAVADDDDKASIAEISASPALLKVLAKLGASLKEDVGLPPDVAGMGSEDVESLMKSDAYWDPKHPDHSKVKNQVTRYYQLTGGRKAA